MCGIYFYIGERLDPAEHARRFASVAHRGPDSSTLRYMQHGAVQIVMGVHRLAITAGHENEQPLNSANAQFICNGEIWNHVDDVRRLFQLWQQYGFSARKLVNGEYVCIGVKLNHARPHVYCFGDTLGIVPMHYEQTRYGLYMCSEARALDNPVRLPAAANFKYVSRVHVLPVINFDARDLNFSDSFSIAKTEPSMQHLYSALRSAVQMRMRCAGRVAYLLSGGLDSSTVAALASEFSDKENLYTFTISLGDKLAPDIYAARRVAQHIKSIHTELTFTWQQALDALPECITALESYDQTTVRAAVPMYLAARELRARGFKAVFSGELADELFMGYQYFHAAPNARAARASSMRLLRDVHHFDALRVDRCMSAHGLEARLPFADTRIFKHVCALRSETLVPHNGIEKYYLRHVLDTCAPDLLPSEILWRSKQALSDSSSSRSSWREQIAAARNDLSDSEWFFALAGNIHTCVPYTWMPEFCDARDSSATCLANYVKDEFEKY